jgi:ferredoxin
VYVPRAHPDETAAAPVRIVVDLNRCEAYAQCCFLAPSVFELHGEEALWYDPEPSSAERDRVLRAAASCPVQAIRVESSPPDGRSRR